MSALQFSRASWLSLQLSEWLSPTLPGLTIGGMWLFYGIFRSSVMLPTIGVSTGKKMSERGIFYGILTAWIIGEPMYLYSTLTHSAVLNVLSCLFVVLIPGILAKCMHGGVAPKVLTPVDMEDDENND